MRARSWKTLVSIVCAMWSLAWIAPGACEAQSAGVPQAVVEAIKGTATVAVDQDEEPEVLAPKSVVKAWNMVSTDDASKLLLNWSSGILSSLGPFTSLFLTSNQTDRGPLDCFEMTEGILRVNTPAGGRPVAPFMVATPVAQIEQVNPDEPVDFIVEVHEPSTTNVTVIAGTVRVKNITLNQPTETVVSACQNVYVEKARPTFDIAALSADDMNGLVEASTITGSIATTFMCPTPSVQLPPPPPPSSSVPSYAYEDWGSDDAYPFDEITIAPPQPGVGCVVVLPWIGRWVIPVDAFVGWRFDPVLMRIYCRRVVMDHIIYSDRYYLTDMSLRRRQLRHMVYLAQLSGNTNMLLDAQRKLTDINVRSQWAALRLKRLEGNMSALEKEQQKFAHNMPQGRNVFQAIAHSFNSPKNMAVARDFRNRVNADLAVQSQLARLTGKEAYDLRSRIAREKNPRERMALQEQLAKFNRDVAQGKIPIPAKDVQLKQAVNRLVKERDPKKLKDVEKQFDRVAKISMPHTSEVLNQTKINALKQDLAKYPNAGKRRDLEQQVSQLQRSVDARVSAEQNIRKIGTIADEASRQEDPRKRNELLGQLKALSSQPAVPAAGLAAGLHQLGQRQLLQTQLSLEKDKQTRATLEKTLEDQRKLQSDLLRQHQAQPQRVVPTQKQQEELRKQTDQQRPDHRLPQPGGQVMPVQPGKPDLQKQQADQLLKQKEQSDRMRLQQEQTEKLRQKEQTDRSRQQQDQADQLRKQKEQSDRMRLQQEQTEKLRQKEQADRLRQQQDQADQLRKQKEQSDRMRLQQEQTEKLRQKEQADRLRQQQDQAERARSQQKQMEQMRQQQQQTDRLRQQQDQAERARSQQKQMEQMRQQQQQMRQQQQQTDRLRQQQDQAERARSQQKQMEQMRQHQNRQPEEDPRRKLQPR